MNRSNTATVVLRIACRRCFVDIWRQWVSEEPPLKSLVVRQNAIRVESRLFSAMHDNEKCYVMSRDWQVGTPLPSLVFTFCGIPEYELGGHIIAMMEATEP